MAVYVRPLIKGEKRKLEGFVKSGNPLEPGLAQRAKIIQMSEEGWHVPQIAEKLNVHHHTVRRYVHRFNQEGLSGLNDLQRRGRTAFYKDGDRQKIIVIARTNPQTLGQPFDHWTLATLQSYLRGSGIALNIGRETIRRILKPTT